MGWDCLDPTGGLYLQGYLRRNEERSQIDARALASCCSRTGLRRHYTCRCWKLQYLARSFHVDHATLAEGEERVEGDHLKEERW
jgi:hypothetical protein